MAVYCLIPKIAPWGAVVSLAAAQGLYRSFSAFAHFRRSSDVLLDDLGDAVFIVTEGDDVRRFLDLRLGVRHGDTQTGIADHRQVVQSVAAGDDVLALQPSRSISPAMAAPLSTPRAMTSMKNGSLR